MCTLPALRLEPAQDLTSWRSERYRWGGNMYSIDTEARPTIDRIPWPLLPGVAAMCIERRGWGLCSPPLLRFDPHRLAPGASAHIPFMWLVSGGYATTRSGDLPGRANAQRLLLPDGLPQAGRC